MGNEQGAPSLAAWVCAADARGGSNLGLPDHRHLSNEGASKPELFCAFGEVAERRGVLSFVPATARGSDGVVVGIEAMGGFIHRRPRQIVWFESGSPSAR